MIRVKGSGLRLGLRVSAWVGPRARAHIPGQEEERDATRQVGEGHRYTGRDKHKEERREDVVVRSTFVNLKRESGKIVKAALFSTILTRFP